MKKRNQGFTLVEIMIVVVIIGLLAAMAIPAFKQARNRSQNTGVVNNMRQVTSAAEQYFMKYGVTTVLVANLFGNESEIKGSGTGSWLGTWPESATQGTAFVVSTLPTGVGGTAADDHTPLASSATITMNF